MSEPQERAVERKAMRFELKEADVGSGHFTGYASVFGNRDSYGDVIEPGAFAKTIDEHDGSVPVLWQHDPDQPIGVSTMMREDDKGLFVEADVSMSPQGKGPLAMDLLKMKAVRGLSIGFEAVQKSTEAGLRRLTEIKLWEFSVVTFPANELALVSGVKSERLLEALSMWATDEQKVGRVLSASNRTLVESALEALQALLEASEPSDDTQGSKGAANPTAEPAPATPGVIENLVFGGSR